MAVNRLQAATLILFVSCSNGGAPGDTEAPAAPTTVGTTASGTTISSVAVTSEPVGEVPAETTIEITRDLAYVEPLTEAAFGAELDVYSPTEVGPHPVVLVLHGSGATREMGQVITLSRQLSEEGMVVFTPTHAAAGLLPQDVTEQDGRRVREAIEDTLCALRYASGNAAKYGGDPESVTIVGQSAGGFLGMIALLAREDVLVAWEEFGTSRDSIPQVACSAGDSLPAIIELVGFNGAFFVFEMVLEDDPALWAVVNPRSYLDTGFGTVRMILGGMDTNTPDWHVANVRAFNADLLATGYDSAVVDIAEASHGFTTSGPIWDETLAAILLTVGLP